MNTPASSRHARTLSPPLSTSSQALTAGQQQRLNVVTRLAIEGKAKQGENGAAIKMYLKVRETTFAEGWMLTMVIRRCHCPWIASPQGQRYPSFLVIRPMLLCTLSFSPTLLTHRGER